MSSYLPLMQDEKDAPREEKGVLLDSLKDSTDGGVVSKPLSSTKIPEKDFDKVSCYSIKYLLTFAIAKKTYGSNYKEKSCIMNS